MEEVFHRYKKSYIELLPTELKRLLARYTYGNILIRAAVHVDGTLKMDTLAFFTEKSLAMATLYNMPKSDLAKYVTIKLPIDRDYLEFNDEFIKIYKGDIEVGDNPSIKFIGDDMTTFMLKLRQLYNDQTLKPGLFHHYY